MTSEPLTISSSGFDAASFTRGVSVTRSWEQAAEATRVSTPKPGRRRLAILTLAPGSYFDPGGQFVSTTICSVTHMYYID